MKDPKKVFAKNSYFTYLQRVMEAKEGLYFLLMHSDVLELNDDEVMQLTKTHNFMKNLYFEVRDK
jgi:hypothetical protein